MPEKNLNQRMLLILAVLVVAGIMLWPPGEKLRPGLDIAGGTSLIYEIDDTGMEDVPSLAEQMKQLLQRRVDPQGVYNLVWRVHGRNRLEIQMPLPPAESASLRNEYIAARDELFSENIRRSELESALQLPPDQRVARIGEIARGSQTRVALLTAAAERYDAYARALDAEKAATADGAAVDPAKLNELRVAVRDATEDFEDAIDAAMGSNLDPQRFQEILDLEPGPRRDNSLKELAGEHPELKSKIDAVVTRFAAWRAKRGFLDGPADLQRLLKGAGKLEFRMLAEPDPGNPTRYDRLREELADRGPRSARDSDLGWFPIDNPISFFDMKSQADLRARDLKSFEASHGKVVGKYNDRFFVLSKLGNENGLLAGATRPWRLKRSGVSRDESGRLCVTFGLDAIGGDLFRDLTGRNIEKQMGIYVDDVAYSAATIKSAIGAQGQITGDFGREKVNYLVQTMQAGALPARLKDTPLSERTIGSSLGEENLRKALFAGYIGAAAVMLIMAAYYLVCGLIANVALTLNVLLTLAAMAMLGARFTLDGIAGVILSVGMAVDANVLIYERMREEKARGSSLRMLVKSGFDKAFTTIFDSNITTLLICVVLYYVGSDEVRGFGLTLGWGIALNMFCSVFVTRTIFLLLIKYGVIKEIKMNFLIGVPNIDWYGMRKYFLPGSALLLVAGLGLMFSRGPRDFLDVEFLGGVDAEIQLKQAGLNDVDISKKLGVVGGEIARAGQQLSQAEVKPVAGSAQTFEVSAPQVSAVRLAAMITEPLEEKGFLERGGVDAQAAGNSIAIRVKDGVTLEQVRDFIRAHSSDAALAGQNLARANVGAVLSTGGGEQRGLVWDVTTTETNRALVQHALVTALGDQLRIQPRVAYEFRGDDDLPYPIEARRLESVVPGLPPQAGSDLTDFLGGAAIYLEDLNPPQAIDVLETRLRNMRLQPDYQNLPWRDFELFGIQSAGNDSEGKPVFSSVVIAIADPALPYDANPDRWAQELARKELALAQAALDSEQTLRRVTQFKPQIAERATTQAGLALLLSWAMIIAYVWVRFGRLRYGVAGVIALVHDSLIALAFVGFSGLIGGANHPIGSALMIESFKINMPIVAAILTIIGFSINDTIVIFDRIRELRGRLGVLTPQLINNAINECMSRTILTSTTVLIVILSMYIFGGGSIRGFSFCMLIGCLSGIYSTVALAAPLLVWRWDKKGAVTSAPAMASAPA